MAYQYNYFGLVNRVLEDFNEVPLTLSSFNTATGFQGAVKDWINDALNDIYAWNDVDWPFLWTQKSFSTVINQGQYSYDSSILYVNWDTFNILRAAIPVSTITSVGLVATVTVPNGHQLIANRNDFVTIQGANQVLYNGTFAPIIVSPTVFQYVLPAATTSPATGTITIYPPYDNHYLGLKNYDEYLRDYRDMDVNASLQAPGRQAPSLPSFIIRKPDNNFILSPYPDRVYTIGYDCYVNPDLSSLSNPTDIPLIPSVFRQAIIDRTSIYCLAFRDNDSQLLRNDSKFTDNCNRMRRILIPQAEYIISKN